MLNQRCSQKATHRLHPSQTSLRTSVQLMFLRKTLPSHPRYRPVARPPSPSGPGVRSVPSLHQSFSLLIITMSARARCRVPFARRPPTHALPRLTCGMAQKKAFMRLVWAVGSESSARRYVEPSNPCPPPHKVR